VNKRPSAPGPFGLTEDGEPLYWPDRSFLSVAIPAPMEQLLERFGEVLDMSPEEAAVFLLRNALVDSHRLLGSGWARDRSRYGDETNTEKAGSSR
jgi:hypothetical protein